MKSKLKSHSPKVQSNVSTKESSKGQEGEAPAKASSPSFKEELMKVIAKNQVDRFVSKERINTSSFDYVLTEIIWQIFKREINTRESIRQIKLLVERDYVKRENKEISIVKENNVYSVCGCFDVSNSISLILAEEKQKVADALNKHEKIIRKHLWCNEKCFDLLKKELKL